MESQRSPSDVRRVAEMFAAMGNEARVRIVRLLLAAHPDGMVVGEIQGELGIPNSTLSHNLDKLRRQDLVKVRRDRQYLWYTANTDALRELLGFLFAECCTRNRAVDAEEVIQIQ
jgi:DNA-binding transcriptional ArsR family regulator